MNNASSSRSEEKAVSKGTPVPGERDASDAAGAKNSETKSGFLPDLALEYEETRYPTEPEKKWIQKCLNSSRVISIVLYSLAAVLALLVLMLFTGGEGAPSLYLGGTIAIVVCLWIGRQQYKEGQATYERTKLWKIEGKFDLGEGYSTDYVLSHIPIFLPPPWGKYARKHRGEHMEMEGYMSEKNMFYVLEVPALDLSIERDIENGDLSV